MAAWFFPSIFCSNANVVCVSVPAGPGGAGWTGGGATDIGSLRDQNARGYLAREAPSMIPEAARKYSAKQKQPSANPLGLSIVNFARVLPTKNLYPNEKRLNPIGFSL